MRRRLVVVLLLALALPALALASHKDPKKQLSAADKAKAASILLKRADFVAGWKRVPSTPDDDTHYDCPGYDPDGSDLVLTGEAEADFERTGGFPAVYSFANVYKTRAHAGAAWSRTVKPALPACLGKMFKDEASAEGGRVTVTGAGRVSFPRLAPRTAAYRVTMRIHVTEQGKTTAVPLTMYMVALGNGRGDAGLMTLGFGTSTPLADVRTLAAVMAQRLAAAKL